LKTLNRLFILLLAAAVLGSAYGKYTGTTHVTIGHDNIYTIHYPWLQKVYVFSLLGSLIWSAVFLRREPNLARIAIVAVAAATALLFYATYHPR
jgi:hypothetical protein